MQNQSNGVFSRVPADKCKYLDSEVGYMLEYNIAEPSSSSWVSQCLLVPKSDKTPRFCSDFRKVNSVTKPKFVSKYLHLQLHMAWIHIKWCLWNAPAIFQHLEGCAVYLDDVVIESDSWDSHVLRIHLLFERLSAARLTIKLVKCDFAQWHTLAML